MHPSWQHICTSIAVLWLNSFHCSPAALDSLPWDGFHIRWPYREFSGRRKQRRI